MILEPASKRGRTNIACYVCPMHRALRLTAVAVLLAGCALPPPRPIWRALVPVDPYVMDGPLGPRQRMAFDRRLAAERARRFVADKLPSTSHLLRDELVRDGFLCRADGGAEIRCAYEEARPPSPCLPTIMASVDVVFPTSPPSRWLAADEVRVAASVVEDRTRRDNRGCVPL